MEIVYVLIAVAVAVVAYFLFVKKGEPETPQLEDRKKGELPSARKKAEPAAPKKAARKPEPEEEEEEEGEEESERAPRAEAPPSEPQPEEAAEEPRVSVPSLVHERDVSGVRKGLAKSRGDEGFFGKLKALITGRTEIDPSIAEEIEEVLLASDVGVKTTETLLARIKESLDNAERLDTTKVWEALRDEARRVLDVEGESGAFPLVATPTVVLMVGVNGAGKTTTIGKLATKLKGEGKQCLLAAGDTFRAAAVQQLVVWGDRVGCEVVRGKDGADPGSVVFDAVKRGEELGADVVLVDTAGRLHTKRNLMAELQKVVKTASKALEGAPHEVLLVLDATNGQNALAQAKEFKEHLELTGLVLTKLDGTAKGGMILGICDELGLPVRFVGLGERAVDLHDFEPDEFVEALLGKDEESTAA